MRNIKITLLQQSPKTWKEYYLLLFISSSKYCNLWEKGKLWYQLGHKFNQLELLLCSVLVAFRPAKLSAHKAFVLLSISAIPLKYKVLFSLTKRNLHFLWLCFIWEQIIAVAQTGSQMTKSSIIERKQQKGQTSIGWNVIHLMYWFLDITTMCFNNNWFVS